MRIIVAILLVAACGNKAEGEFVQIDPPGPPASEPETCGAPELCTRSIQECAVELDQAECEAWYVSEQCTDIDAYTTCNCTCEAQAECNGYFACGEICFEDHC